MLAASAGSSFFLRRRMLCRSSPSMYSIVMNLIPSASPKSKMRMTFLWVIWRARINSCLKRFQDFRTGHHIGANHFQGDLALQLHDRGPGTRAPMPPCPSKRMISLTRREDCPGTQLRGSRVRNDHVFGRIGKALRSRGESLIRSRLCIGSHGWNL